MAPWMTRVSGTDPILLALVAGVAIGVLLGGVGLVETVRHQGWGKQTWAPPAKPWLGTSAAVLVITLGCGVLWATGS